MNRYTFKARRKDNGEWVYGYYYVSTCYGKNIEHIMVNNRGFEIIPETLCQCIGLQDIDGNYIFENDIVKVINITGFFENRIDTIIWGNIYPAFDCEHNDNEFNELSDIEEYDFKVLGNKFDKEED